MPDKRKCVICKEAVYLDMTVITNLGKICESCYNKHYDKITSAAWYSTGEDSWGYDGVKYKEGDNKNVYKGSEKRKENIKKFFE